MRINGLESITWFQGVPRVKLSGFKPDTYPDGVSIASMLAGGDANTKTRKNNGRGYLSAGLSLAPHQSAGVGNVCTDASAGCVAGCLAGQGLASVFQSITYVRRCKTSLWYVHRAWFLERVRADLETWQRKAQRAGLRLCVRLNMFSDLAWERYEIPQSFPDVMFYDYTKHASRAGLVCPNYWVTFSRSETNEIETLETLASGSNVAVVFYNDGAFTGNRSHLQRLPKTWRGFSVVDGDTTDLRFDDPRGRSRGRVIGLRLKAHSNESRQSMIDSGFAIRTS